MYVKSQFKLEKKINGSRLNRVGEEEMERVGLGHEQAALVGTDCNATGEFFSPSFLLSFLPAFIPSFLVVMGKI